MNELSVSVIIPAYNGELYICEAIESALRQTIKPLEILVVDNGSSDRTESFVSKFHGVRYIRTETANVGAARQLGVNQSLGNFVAFLDQDDVWLAHKTEMQLDYLNKNPDKGAVIGLQSIFLEPGVDKPHWLKESFIRRALPGYLPSALMVRRDMFNASGGFDTNFLMASDVDWFFNAHQNGVSVGMVDCVVVEKRIHGHNDSYNVSKSQNEILRVIKRSLILRREKNEQFSKN
ncbi:glycosyltransferase family A protein [Polynucleobacter sp. es-MAR-4]|uniref:glycosyltransferase family A protein n=1 Tax=Polynucleobacter sp. es-MAR-4 TaxID=1855655 RepID=UPI001C0E2226|nr:glycosyltransferase family A protein [Polynucleobacter sp. es-MAR-4]MBU3637346.1 glycosyltransferase family 2 protein [Polynucleobacter sp. es-MAR-4]